MTNMRWGSISCTRLQKCYCQYVSAVIFVCRVLSFELELYCICVNKLKKKLQLLMSYSYLYFIIDTQFFCLISVASWCSTCWFVYVQFCHGSLKLDMSTLFTTFFLWTSLQFMLSILSELDLFNYPVCQW